MIFFFRLDNRLYGRLVFWWFILWLNMKEKNEAIKVSVIAYRFHIGFSLKSTTRPASYYTTHHMHYALQPPKHGGPKSKKKIVQLFLKFLIKLVHIFDLSPIIFSNCDGESSVKSHSILWWNNSLRSITLLKQKNIMNWHCISFQFLSGTLKSILS